MPARDFVSKNQPIIAVVCVLGLAFAIWRIVSGVGTGHHPPDSVWVYNLNDGSVSVAPRASYPPMQLDGGAEGYIAILFSCSKCSDKSSREVAYLFRYSDEVKAIYERGMTESDIGAVSSPGAELVASLEMARRDEWLTAKSGIDRLTEEATAICEGDVEFCYP